MLGLLDPRLWAAIVVACALSYGAGRFQQWRSDEKEHAAALMKAALAAKQVEQNLRDDMGVLDETRTKELLQIARERDVAIADSLRHRAAKRLPQTPQACAGASPAAISAEDAAVALGIASDADKLRAEYARCKAWVETLTDRASP